MLEIKEIKENKSLKKKLFTVSFWNFLVATIALCVSGYTAWKQLRDINDVTQVVYDIGTNREDPYSFLKSSLSLAIYNSGSQPVVLNKMYLYFVEHKLPRTKNRFGQMVIEDRPFGLCRRDASYKTGIFLKDTDLPNKSLFKATIIPKQEIKVINLSYDLTYIFNFLQGYYTANYGNKVNSIEDAEGVFCLASIYSGFSVENISIHEQLFSGRLYMYDFTRFEPSKEDKKLQLEIGVSIVAPDHRQKVY